MLRVMELVRRLALGAGVLLGFAWPAEAHNGAVAIAVPVEGIKVDGDLSDWPAGLRRYPIAQRISGAAAKDTQDCRAAFRIGYNTAESALYVAVVVQDESTVLEDVDVWMRDGCEIYLDLEHGADWSTVFQPLIWGQERKVIRNGTDVLSKPPDLAVRRAEGSTWYEWRIDLASLYEKTVTLDPGTILGFDVVVYDRDRERSSTGLAWGSGSPKHLPANARNRGDVVLVGTDATGKISGQVRWDGQEAEKWRGVARIRLNSLARPEMWLQVRTDRQGRFSMELPAGRYDLEVVGARQKKSVEIEVRRGREEDLGTLVVAPRPLGRTVKAGKGRTVTAGTGVRRGLWQHFNVEDGLPSNVVFDVFQDRQGYLWFGTRGGLCRYDGAVFTTFTVEDGLPDNRISSIGQDHQGNLWLGSSDQWTVKSGGGVTRYDGEFFTSFNTEDGLADNLVPSIAEDREGNLWFGTWFGGVSRYDGRRITSYTPGDGFPYANRVRAMLKDPEGQLWFRNREGTCRFDGEGFVPFVAPGELVKRPLGQPLLWDHRGNLWLGQGDDRPSAPPLGVSRYDGRNIVTLMPGYRVNRVLEDRDGNMWFADWPDGGLTRYDGKGSTRFAPEDLSMNNWINAMIQDREGYLWVGTGGGGVSRYDSYQLPKTIVDSALSDRSFNSIAQDSAGNLWFGSWGSGLCRYDGSEFHTFTTKDGLLYDNIRAVYADTRGGIWTAAWDRRGDTWSDISSGVSYYDGHRFTNFTTRQMLGRDGNHPVISILQDQAGNVWFGTFAGGAVRYDGRDFVAFTTADGLVQNDVLSMMQDHQGNLWFGTRNGGSRYDGRSFRNFTAKDGLPDSWVVSILEDRQGIMWFGLDQGGVSRYDGKQFDSLRQEGLGDGTVNAILEDRRGHLWFAIANGGVVRYDGSVFQRFSERDGLPSDDVRGLLQDHGGGIWIVTGKGVVRYRPDDTLPVIRITSVTADRNYAPTETISLPTTQERVVLGFQGISFKTRPQQMTYLYQMKGYDADWQQTRNSQVEYEHLPLGQYVFQVKAVDRDLNYSSPAEVRLVVHWPYGLLALFGTLGLSLVGLATVSGYALRKRRAQRQAEQALMQEMEKELQTAHEMQMALMPKAPPQIQGFEITGRCVPANHVGGDLFQYFHQHDRLSISLADVTGHAMEAAIPVVMFSGILRSHIGMGGTVEELFGKLNQALHGTLTGHTLVCLAMGELDPATHRFRFSNAGCPYPYHYRAATGDVMELRMDAYPLGVRPDTTYRGAEVQLEPGDRVVFCSDGIAEAANATGEMFGFERTAETIRRGCREDLSAEGLLARIIEEVKAFSGEVPQGDDQTVVVLKVDDRRSA